MADFANFAKNPPLNADAMPRGKHNQTGGKLARIASVVERYTKDMSTPSKQTTPA
jgi:hypothetical protein